MIVLQVEKLSKSYGDKDLFLDISFGMTNGQKIGLIAANGTGKTTLLKIMANEDFSDTGSVILRNDIRLGFLSQNPDICPDKTVFSSIFESDSPVTRAINAYNEALQFITENKTDISTGNQRLEEATAMMDQAQA